MLFKTSLRRYQIETLALKIKLVLKSLQYLTVVHSQGELKSRITFISCEMMHVGLMSMFIRFCMFTMFEMHIFLLEMHWNI